MVSFAETSPRIMISIILCMMSMACSTTQVDSRSTNSTHVVVEVNEVFDPITGRKLYRECCITRGSGHVDCGCYYCSDEDEACGYGGSDDYWTGGEIAGVVIGVLAILGLTVGICCYCHKRKRHMQTDRVEGAQNTYQQDPKSPQHVTAVPMGYAATSTRQQPAFTSETHTVEPVYPMEQNVTTIVPTIPCPSKITNIHIMPDGSKKTETIVYNSDGSKTTTIVMNKKATAKKEKHIPANPPATTPPKTYDMMEPSKPDTQLNDQFMEFRLVAYDNAFVL